MAVKHVKGISSLLECLTSQMLQWFCLVQWLSTQFLEAALKTVHFLCLLNQTNPIQVISQLVKTPRLEMCQIKETTDL